MEEAMNLESWEECMGVGEREKEGKCIKILRSKNKY